MISIVTVTYNAEQFLKRTLDSIWCQTSDNYEVIVVDGASKDGTTEILKEYPNRRYSSLDEAVARNVEMKTIHWISERDGGLYDAMNKGIDMAKGDFVWFMNAGDQIFDDHVIENIEKHLSAAPLSDVVYGQTMIVDEQGVPLGDRAKRAPEKLTFNSLLKGMVVCHQSILVKRSLASHYDLKYKISADFDWECRVLKASKGNCYVDGYLSKFLHAGISSQHRKESWKERFSIMVDHFGWLRTIWTHLIIVAKYPFSKKYA